MRTTAQPLTILSRHYYINKQYQSKMILKFCLLALLSGTLFCISFYAAMDRDISGGYGQALEGMRYIREAMIRNFLYTEAAIIVLLGIAVAAISLVMSHRIAGPLWRLEQTAKSVGEGDLTCEIHLRNTDEIKSLADQMNRMTSRLRTRAGNINTLYKLLSIDIARLKERIVMGGGSKEESLALAREILDRCKSLSSALREIKTG